MISLTVNGETYTDIYVKPHWTLHHLLHDQMGFTEIKTMCTGLGQCGSCTIIMDGRPILSCLTLAASCDGAVIQTSVGIADENHPLIESYIKYHCMQCGYCTPGFITTAKALLDKNPDPTEEEIALALEGNLCRCSTYPTHISAVLEAAAKLKGEE
jgi:aerobic-type carbon monoxide dehydrogenase small subunit (CoxS/CutS family)